MKTDFKLFPIGTVFNPLKQVVSRSLDYTIQEVDIKFPSRLNAMAIDPSKIVSNNNLVYTPGEITFVIDIFTNVSIKKSSTAGLSISDTTQRKSLVSHAFLLMQKAIGFEDGLHISVSKSLDMRHCGLGSSSNLIASVSVAINELYGKPIDDKELVRYCAQNHGEEIDGNDEELVPVQSIGGSAAAGLVSGGMQVLAGESVVIKNMNISDEYSVVIGIPKDYVPLDAKESLDKELSALDGFLNTGKVYGKEIAYNILHDGLPAMECGNLIPFGNIIFEYRFNMGSINNCSFCYPPIMNIAEKISFLKHDGYADVLSLSSVGPGFFAITKDPDFCTKTFESLGMNVYHHKIYNGTYIYELKK
ncbi:MAG: hypothetical protein K8Q91_01880 [Candidatus Vogelbacteria bacterium]|nr:hypothetical protein [Candidatus Vogelbacteria bacterium]